MSLPSFPQSAPSAAIPLTIERLRSIPFTLAAQAAMVVVVELAVVANLALITMPSLATAITAWAGIAVAVSTGSTGRSKLALSALDDLPQLAGRIMAATGVVAAGALIFGNEEVTESVLIIGAVSLPLVFACRCLTYVILRRVRTSARGRDEAVIVGSGEVANFIANRLTLRPEFGLEIVGYADSTLRRVNPARSGRESRRICSLDHFPQSLATTNVRTVIFTYSREREADMMQLVRASAAAGYRTYVVPRFYESTARSSAADSIWGIPLTRIQAPGTSGQATLKRGFDLVVAAITLLLLAPLLLLITLVLPRETSAPILFRQDRIGQGGRRFELLKFQTMKPETRGEGDTTWNIANDNRLGPFGRFLRRTSLDELPQMVNVLRGDMALVGPRPERPHFVEKFTAEHSHYSDRHRVPVGLTGWAQVNRLRGDTSISDRALFDNVYCDNWSLWEDSKIMFRTVPEVLRSAGG